MVNIDIRQVGDVVIDSLYNIGEINKTKDEFGTTTLVFKDLKTAKSGIIKILQIFTLYLEEDDSLSYKDGVIIWNTSRVEIIHN